MDNETVKVGATSGEASDRQNTGPMARWLRVLQGFLQARDWGVRDLAEFIGVPRSAVHRMLHEMERLDLLAATGTGRWRLGPELIHLVVGLADRIDVLEIARPQLLRAAELSDETVYLSLYSPARRRHFVAELVYGDHPYRQRWSERLHQWEDLHVGSDGKAILAFLPTEQQEIMLASLPDPVPSLAPQDRATFVAYLDEVRQLGFANSHGERYPGSLGASAPFFGEKGELVGSITISWPEARDQKGASYDFGQLVLSTANTVSFALGYRATSSEEAVGEGVT